METSHDLSMLGLIANASIVVQLVMLGLALASMASWAMIFSKLFAVRHAVSRTLDFEQRFWSGADLNRLYTDVQGRSLALERIFEAGFTEFMKQRKTPGAELADVMDSTRRAMKASSQRELDQLDGHLSFLATVGSVSPYVGLFGTVWGIMNSFRALGSVGQATLAHVAPGIAEALIATAIGLFAAIPAVIAYNRFAADIDRLAVRFESFIEEFSNILQRQGAHR
ncbi:protein TolQ [Chitinivorax sp. B]|uniref:protein TolQ n=1 Tax=Chitinivorax sp. B TaxID=2502235 RepID=UPI002016BB9A|nr:protein TolQ [Chitinivorax sp. B]